VVIASTPDAHRREKYFKTTAGKPPSPKLWRPRKALGLILRDTLAELRA
jgi:hypothetical protein